MRRHVNVRHLGYSTGLCAQCGITMLTGKDLRIHVSSLHAYSAEFKCHTCGKYTTSKSRLEHHIKFNHNMTIEDYPTGWCFEKIACPYCDFSSHYKRSVRGHVLNFHKSTPSPGVVKREARKAKAREDGKLNCCMFCKFITAHRSSLSRHIHFRHADKLNAPHQHEEYKCQDCGLITPYKDSFIRHCRRHRSVAMRKRMLLSMLPEEDLYKCTLCECFVSPYKRNLCRHLKKAHGDEAAL